MDEPVSARPEDLEEFARTVRRRAGTFDESVTTAFAALDSFNQASAIGASNYGLRHSTIPGLITEIGELVTQADLVARALRNGDTLDANGVVHMKTSEVDQYIVDIADSEGIDVRDVFTAEEIRIYPPEVGAVPQHTGWVADPVCTGTRALVVDDTDLPMPRHLASLAWRRVYSSRAGTSGPLGTGWSTWAQVMCRRDGSSVRYRGPDGVAIDLVVAADGSVPDRPHLDLRVELEGSTGGGVALCWGQRSSRPGERWEFRPNGQIRSVRTGPGERVDLSHDSSGRLVRMEHARGPHLDIRWEGYRIANVTAWDGRQVTYAYDNGHLVGVQRPAGDLAFVLDDAGRIIEEHDADGILLARTEYDAAGEVLEQFDAEGTRLGFTQSGLRSTRIVDDTEAAIAEYRHDLQGRVTAITPGDGPRLERDFDGPTIRWSRLGDELTEYVTSEPAADGSTTTQRLVDGEVVETFRHDAQHRLIGHTDRLGSTSRITMDDDGQIVELDSGGSVQRLRWEDGLLVGVVDPDGVTVDVAHDSQGRISEIRGHGRRVGFERGESGHSVAHIDGVGEFRYHHDGAGRLVDVTDPMGATRHIEFSPAGRPMRIVDADGSASTIAYDRLGRPSTVTDPRGGVTQLEWWDDRLLSEIVNPAGDAWQFEWSPAGQLTALEGPGGERWEANYDDNGHLLSRTDPTGAVTQHPRPENGRSELVGPIGDRWITRTSDEGRTTEWIDPLGGTSSRHLNALGRPVREVDADGRSVTHEWSEAGRLLATTDDLGTVRHTWDDAGRCTATSRDGAVTHQEWDAAGRGSAITDADGVRTELVHGPLGQLLEVVTSAGRWIHEYDICGRPLAITAADGSTVRQVRDDAGHRIATVNASGATTSYEHDEMGRPTVIHTPGGRTLRRGHDAWGRLSTVVDGHGAATRLFHDPLGRIERIEHADGSVLEADIDAAGRTTGWSVDGVDALHAAYDAAGRLTSMSSGDADSEMRFEWSPASRLESIEDRHGRSRWVHDRAAELRFEHTGPGDDTDNTALVITRRIGVDGRPSAIGIDDLDVRIDRSAAGRLTAISTGSQTVEVARDELGLPSSLTVDGSQVASVERDPMGRVHRLNTAADVTRFDYDAEGQLVGTEGPGGSWTFTYGPDGTLDAESGPRGQRTFDHDANGALTEEIGPDGATVFTHDARGRRISEVGPRGTRTFEWSPFDQLTAIVDDGRRTEIHYDPSGRVRSIGDTPIVWDEALGDEGLVQVGGRRMAKVAGVVLLADADTVRVDEPGRLLGPDSDATGDWWGWDPDGRTTTEPVIGWRGEIHVAGLVLLGRRVFDPATRSMLSRDAALDDSAASWSHNSYHYAGNDPVNHHDPSGYTRIATVDELQVAHDDATGIQWGTVAMVGTIVVGTVLVVASGGTLTPLVLGGIAAAGAVASHYGQSVDAYGDVSHVDYGAMATDAVLAGATGYVGGAITTSVTPLLTGATTSATRQVITEGVVGSLADGAVATGYSVGDQYVSTGHIDMGTAFSAGGGAAATSAVQSTVFASGTAVRSHFQPPQAPPVIHATEVDIPGVPPGFTRTDTLIVPQSSNSLILQQPPGQLITLQPPGQLVTLQPPPGTTTTASGLHVVRSELYIPGGR